MGHGPPLCRAGERGVNSSQSPEGPEVPIKEGVPQHPSPKGSVWRQDQTREKGASAAPPWPWSLRPACPRVAAVCAWEDSERLAGGPVVPRHPRFHHRRALARPHSRARAPRRAPGPRRRGSAKLRAERGEGEGRRQAASWKAQCGQGCRGNEREAERERMSEKE